MITRKIYLAVLVGLMFFTFNSWNVSAAGPKTTTNFVSAPASDGFRTSKQIGIGLATAAAITYTDTAFTGWFELDEKNAVQAYFGMGRTSPNVLFGIAGLFKHTILESQAAGLHIGGGVGLGNPNATFAASIAGVAGFHAQFPGAPRVRLGVDGGPVLIIQSGNTNFGIVGLSPALGFNLVYVIN